MRLIKQAMEKKGLTYPLQFTFGLIIAMLFFGSVMFACSKLLYSQDRSDDSFDELVNKISSASEYDSTQSIGLYMKQPSYIIGFTKDAKEVKSTIWGYSISRPIDCGNSGSTACICLCEENILEDYGVGGVLTCGELNDKMNCERLDNIDFQNRISYGLLNPLLKEHVEGVYYYLDGFVIEMSKDYPKEYRLRTIYIEREDNYVAVCNNPPCLSNEVFDVDTTDSFIHIFPENSMVTLYNPETKSYLVRYIIGFKKNTRGKYYYDFKTEAVPEIEKEKTLSYPVKDPASYQRETYLFEDDISRAISTGSIIYYEKDAGKGEKLSTSCRIGSIEDLTCIEETEEAPEE